MNNQFQPKKLKYRVIISLLIFFISIVPQNLHALDRSEILEAANIVGSKSATDYQKALVLRYFDEIKAFREENKISNEIFQKTMAWFRITHLQIAIKAASNKGFTAVEQQVSNDAAEYRVRSDTDILLSRKNGRKPITLEDVQAVEREHRRLLKAMTRKLAKNAKKSIDISGDFKTDTDFMVPPDLTTPTEFDRLNRYFNAKGSATYRRPDAARVEAKIRDNKPIGIKEGSQYVDEMIEQIANAKSDKGREKYIRRINDLHERLMTQVGLTLSAEDKVNNTTFSKKVLKSHIKILGEVVNSANSTPKARQHARFIIALKLYDLPDTETNSLLKKLPTQFRKEVKNEINKFKEEAPSKSEASRIKSFLQKTAGGRKLLAKYDWVFKELTKERGQRNNTATIADVTSSLLKTSRYVGNYAHSLNLWMNVIRQVHDAKTDADLAIALGKTLASKTYYGMVADQLYTSVTELTEGNLTKAATGAVKFVTLWLCPEVAIPEVVQSIGDTAIDITSSILFDKQFMALYLASTFDSENGTLLSIGDYKGKAPACQFIDDALIPGGHSLINGVFDQALKLAKKKNLSVEVVSGINDLGRRALIKAISSTIYNGKPLVLQNYQPLASSCSDVAKLTNNINDFTEGLGYNDTIPKNEEASWLDETGYFKDLEPAAKRPLKALLTLRSDAWKKVKKNLCAGITKNIVSRHKAELALDKDSGKEAEKLHKRIETVFKELKIYTFGMKRLEADGSTNIIMRNFVTSTKDQQIKAMQALQRYLVNYKRVLTYRQQAEAYFKFLTGESLVRRPLTNTPPLAVEPEFDANLASSYMEEILSSVSRIQKSWLQIKRKALNDNEAELDSNFDKDILKKYYIEIFSHAYAATVMKGSSRALNPPSTALGLPLRIVTGELFKDLRYRNLHDTAFKTTQETWEKRKKLDTEFKSHYQNIKIILSINLPEEIKNGQGIVGSKYSFSTKSVNIPDEAAFSWFINDKKIATSDSIEHSFNMVGKYQLRVIASWKKSERITNEGSIEDKVNIQIKQFEKSEDKTDTRDINKDKDNKNTVDNGDRVKSTPKPEENNGIEKRWIAKIEEANTKKDWKKLLKIHTELGEANRQKYHSSFITREPFLAPAKLLGKYLNEFAQIKWDWFKKDVQRYLGRLDSQSEGKYAALESKVTQILLERNGTQEEADKCLEDAKKEVRATRKLIRQAKKEYAFVTQKMFDSQGSPVEILNLIKDFIVKYRIPENLKVSVSYSSTCVGKYDENATKKLKVKISGAKTITMSPKETVTLNANVTGGKAPVNISWEGENISPSGSRAIFTASTPGTYTIQVTAKDAKGRSVSDSVTVRIREKIEPALFGLSDTVYYGKTYPITVGIPAQKPKENKPLQDDPCKGHKQTQNPFDPCNKIIIDRDSKGNKVREYVPDPSKEGPYDVPPIADTDSGEYEYIWQPAGGDGLEFNPPSGSTPKVNVTFGNIGEIEIWAEVRKNGEKVGETKRIKTKVIPPNFTLNISPAAPYVGGESKATIDVSPDIDNKYLNFRWLPMGDNIQELGESNNGRAYRFKTKSIKSSKIEVLVWAVPYAEEQIADLKQVVSAKPYKVDVKVLGPLGPKPTTWKEGKGLVEVDKEIAVHQNVRLEAKVTPEPKGASLRYEWKLNEDSHFAGGESGKEVTLNRSQTGTCIATVIIKDKDGNVLGKGSGSFSVSISQKQINGGKQKAKNQKQAQELLQEGRKLWEEGKLKQAIAKIAQAQKLTEKDKEIAKILKAMQKQKRDLDNILKEVVKSIERGELQKAEEMLSKAARVNDKYPEYMEVFKQLSDAKRRAAEKKRKLAILLKDAKVLKDAGKFNEAVAVLKKGTKQFPANKEIDKLLKDVQTQQAVEDALSSFEPPKTEKADNIGGVINGPKKPTTFRFDTRVKLLFLQTYHWNNGIGMTSPGKIGLRHSDGTMYGPWQTRGYAGQGGVPNAYWRVNPNVPLKPGVYTVVDSDPKTWATNAQEDWKGFAIIRTGPLNYPDEKSVGDNDSQIPEKIASLVGSWKFGRSKHYGKPVHEHLCDLVLTDEFVKGIGYKIKSCNSNESYWILKGKTLLFVALDGTVTTKFTQARPNYWGGTYVGSAHSSEGVVHYLKRLENTDKPHTNTPYDTSVSNQGPLHAGTGIKRIPGGAIRSGKGIRRNPGEPVSAHNGTDSLSLLKKVYEPGEKIKLSFTESPQQDAWVGMYHSNQIHNKYDNKEITYQDLNHKPKGQKEFTAPTKEGDYDFRVYERSSRKELVSIKFSVKVDKAASSLSLPKSIFEPGEKIKLSFTESPLQDAWVGMYHSNQIHNKYDNKEITYQDLNHKPKGQKEFTAPTKEGDYDFRMYERSNRKEVATIKFKVRKLPSSVKDGKGNSTRGKEETPNKNVKEQTIRTTVNAPSQGKVENTGSSIRHGSDETSAVTNPTSGYWKLSNTIIYTDPDINSNDCYKSSISLKNGSLSATTSVYKKDCNWHYDESITFTGSWTPPSSVLLPGKSYLMHIDISRSNPVRQWGADDYISLYMDNYETGCGSATGSAVDITNERVKVGWRPSNPSSNSWSGRFIAPAYGDSNSRKTNNFQIKAIVRNGCVRYIYEWISKSTTNTSSQR